jgi:hypothetical protein
MARAGTLSKTNSSISNEDMTTTPLTDSQVYADMDSEPIKEWVSADFARALERDRIRLVAALRKHARCEDGGDEATALLCELETWDCKINGHRWVHTQERDEYSECEECGFTRYVREIGEA